MKLIKINKIRDEKIKIYDYSQYYINKILNLVLFAIMFGSIPWTIRDVLVNDLSRNYIAICLAIRLAPLIMLIPYFLIKGDKAKSIVSGITIWLCVLAQFLIYRQPYFEQVSCQGFYVWLIAFFIFTFTYKTVWPGLGSYLLFYIIFSLSNKEFCEIHHIPRTFLTGNINAIIPFANMVSSMFILTVGLIIIGLVFREILDQLIKGQREVKFMMNHDNLTKLENRNSIRTILESDKCPDDYYIIICDIDNFKKFNDEFGHIKGDEILRKASQNLIDTFQRDSDHIVRYGGDEFLIFVKVTSDVKYLLNKLKENCDGYTFSIGCSKYKYPEDYFKTILKQADTALYNVKEEGKNNWKFFDELLK